MGVGLVLRLGKQNCSNHGEIHEFSILDHHLAPLQVWEQLVALEDPLPQCRLK